MRQYTFILILLFEMGTARSYYNMALRMQHNIIKDTILHDSKMPIIYTNKYTAHILQIIHLLHRQTKRLLRAVE